jgi:bifunctional UDP-N-acetylglucosamine pyrophosphorylase/glucosamine-1-phosphate N-acetyltransferase
MRSAMPKHLHPLLGRRVVDWIIEAARPLGADPLVVVVSPDTADQFDGLSLAVQETARGTGDAVRCASAAVGDVDDVLILSGDTPLLTTSLLTALLDEHRRKAAAATVLSFVPDDMRSYGRVVRDADGDLAAIVEAADATPEQLTIREANSSIYLTDAVRDLVESGLRVAVHVAPDPVETEGLNTRVELAAAAAALRDRVNEAHMLAGVTIVDPATTWIEPTVVLAPDTTVDPFTVLRGRTSVAAGAPVGPHVVAVDATIGERVQVGPFCYLRPGTVLAEGAKAGTFVEIKNSNVGARTKVPHLSYIGDADIGEDSNIGAGSITVNLGHGTRAKGRTVIGDNVRTGVDNAFVAPVTIGDDAWIAAGSVITEDVPANALAIARSRQVNKEGRGGKRND